MSTRSVVRGSSVSLPTTDSSDANNLPMDLAQKSTAKSLEAVANTGMVKGATLIHYPQIRAVAATTTHVVGAKPGVRGEHANVTGQAVALLPSGIIPPLANLQNSRHGLHSGASVKALSLSSGSTTSASPASTTSVRTVAQTSSSSVVAASTASVSMIGNTHMGYHIPRGAAAVANMAAPRSQVVATPIVRTTGHSMSQTSTNNSGPRAATVHQRMLPTLSAACTLMRGPPFPLPATKAPTSGITTNRSALQVSRAGQNSSTSVSFYQQNVKGGSVTGSAVRAANPTTQRGTVAGEGISRPSVPKAVHITQPVVPSQKYGSSLGTGLTTAGRSSVTTSLSNLSSSHGAALYPSSQLVTTLASAGTSITPACLKAPTSTAIAVVTSSQVTSQAAGSNIVPVTLTAPSSGCGSSHGSHHTTVSTQKSHVSEQVALKTPVAVCPQTTQQGKVSVQTPALAFPTGSKVITQPVQGPPLSLTQISGLAAVTASKVPVTGHKVQSQQPSDAQSRLGSVLPGGGAVIPSSLTVHAHPANPSHPAGQPGEAQATQTSMFLRAQPASTATTTSGQGEKCTATVTQYITTPYYYESGISSTYPVNGGLVTHTLTPAQYVPASITTASLRVAGANAATVGLSPTNQPAEHSSAPVVTAPPPKPNASPRPSILRKRPDSDGTPLKASKNLAAALSLPISSPPSPKRPDSRGNGNVSSGSTTISANSSPGLQIEEIDNTAVASVSRGKTPPYVKQEHLDEEMPHPSSTDASSNTCSSSVSSLTGTHLSAGSAITLPDGLSPRKKPRKQQLMGNELQEAHSSEEDQPFAKKAKAEINEGNQEMEASEEEEGSIAWSDPGGGSSPSTIGPNSSFPHNNISVVVTQRPQMSLLSSYRQGWKPRCNHFMRHSDIRPKEEKRHTVNEIANSKMALQRVNGWKVIHLSGQVDDLVDLESDVVTRLHHLLSSLERRTHGRKPYKDFEKDVNRLSELVKANIQRSKTICDQMSEAKSQMSKLFDHKEKIIDIMTKYSSKRTIRKREKL